MPSTTNAETPQATTDAEQRPNVCLTVLHYLALVLPYLLQCLLLTTLSFKLLLLAIFLQLALLIMFVVERHLLMVSYRPLASRQLFMVQDALLVVALCVCSALFALKYGAMGRLIGGACLASLVTVAGYRIWYVCKRSKKSQTAISRGGAHAERGCTSEDEDDGQGARVFDRYKPSAPPEQPPAYDEIFPA